MKDLFSLKGKVALITGASSGMGKAIAEAMGYQQARVVISSNEPEQLAKVVQEFQALGMEVTGIACDMAKGEEIENLVNQALHVFEKIDILVNCVGMAPTGSFLDTTSQSFDKTMQLNIQAAMYLTQLVIPPMQLQKDGAIIYLASIAGVRGNRHLGLYGISKAGLIEMARNLAVEFGPDNIRVNTISPGMIQTPFSEGLMSNPVFMEKRLAQTPLRKVGQVAEIAGVVVMLASKAGGFITGQNIIVDGGTTISDGN
jgi:NAD(P)-dependent dehydrogenase (short-subunit alcohol dehydrogenase family)